MKFHFGFQAETLRVLIDVNIRLKSVQKYTYAYRRQ